MTSQWKIACATTALVVGLVACGDDDDSESGGSVATTDASVTTVVAGASTTTAETGAGSGATVAVASDPVLGDILVDGEGLTVYMFERDEGTTSACTEGCAQAWPGFASDAAAAAAGDGVDASLIGTADGQVPNQVTYNGHLLYFYSGDAAPGDTNGVGLPDWYPVDPEGNAIGET